MTKLSDFSLKLGAQTVKPLIVGGMGVDISTTHLALEAARLGAIGHISDAMSQLVSDRRYGTRFTVKKLAAQSGSAHSFDKTNVKFNLDDVATAQRNHVNYVMEHKRGDGLIFINIMEKLTMGSQRDALKARLTAALDGGIDGITLSAGLHLESLCLMKEHARFHDAKIGIIVSSVRALRIFLRSANRVGRAPDYIVVEGPLAGGHLGFGMDWNEFNLTQIVKEVVAFLADQKLDIPVIAAGGVFSGGDAVSMINIGASGVQVATRFTVTHESGLPPKAKQAYFDSKEEDVLVTDVSPTGYPLRMLSNSPCLTSSIKPNCEQYGYMLDKDGKCSYLDAYSKAVDEAAGKKLAIIKEKICLCHHFGRYSCWTCGHYVYRLKDTTNRLPDGSYQLLRAEHVINDYLTSKGDEIQLPNLEKEIVLPATVQEEQCSFA